MRPTLTISILILHPQVIGLFRILTNQPIELAETVVHSSILQMGNQSETTVSGYQQMPIIQARFPRVLKVRVSDTKVDGSQVACFLDWTRKFDWYVVQ